MASIWTTAPEADPVTVLVLVGGLLLMAVIGLVWLALLPEDPPDTTREARERMSARERAAAERNRRRLEADAGRADRIHRDLS